jgi:hypothetical protein
MTPQPARDSSYDRQPVVAKTSETKEIEFTPEMIVAGMKAYYEWG